MTHNPSEIDQAQDLLVRFPNLGNDDVITPGTVNLSFNIELTSTADLNRTLVSNIGRAIIKKLAVKFEGNEIMSIDDFDIFTCYRDLWKTASEKKNAVRQGIISTDGFTPNCVKLRINAGDKSAGVTRDKAIPDAYGNKFIIPLDFEMLDSLAPYYQVGLGNRLCYELRFNDYNRVINSSKTNASYKITDISLEYEIVTQPILARSVAVEYDKMVLLYDRILRQGKPNQLYAQGMRSFEQYDEIREYFAEGVQRDSNANEVQAQLQLYDLSVGEYLTDKYALWLDFRMIDENVLHGMGREIENALEGIILQVEKKAEMAGALNVYIYLIMDARLNIKNGGYVSAVY